MAFHAVLLGLLFLLRPLDPNGISRPEAEQILNIRLTIPNRPRPPAEEAPRPVEEPEEAPTARDPSPAVLVGPEAATEPSRSREEPEAGSPEAPIAVAADLSDPKIPLPIGLGPRPSPPLASGTGVGHGFATRGDGKGEALRRHGGGRETEDAVGLGLKWLAEHQDEDGGWSAEGFQRHCRGHLPCVGKGLAEFDTGVTALALLAFLGAGHVPTSTGEPSPGKALADWSRREPSPYHRHVRKAIDCLLAHQDGRGAIGAAGENFLYNHAIATLALAEAAGLTASARVKESVEAAVTFSAACQQAGGGWDYTERNSYRNDLSITGWQVMAFQAATTAGVTVPESTIAGVRRMLAVHVTADGEGIYTNLGEEKGRRGINMVAVGLLAKLYLGALREERAVRGAAARILRAPPDAGAFANWDSSFQSYYYWYTATLALFHLGGEEWKAWNALLLRKILPLQSQRSHEEGSWPAEMNWIGVSGGRVCATALCVLTLETYYRYAPLHAPRRS